MGAEELARNADECRKLAPEFHGRPERPFLLKLAVSFEELAVEEKSDSAAQSKGSR